MIRFKGRSYGITIILDKLVSIEFKYFILVENGYIINFKCTTPRILKGEDGEDIRNREISILEIRLFTKLSNTQAVVERLVSPFYLKITLTYGYHLYLDNLFVS